MLLVALMPEHDPRQDRNPMATETSWELVVVACTQDADVRVSWVLGNTVVTHRSLDVNNERVTEGQRRARSWGSNGHTLRCRRGHK